MSTDDKSFSAEKQCPKCLNWYPRNAVNFIPRKLNQDGLSSDCRSCWNAYKRRNRLLHLDAERTRSHRYYEENKSARALKSHDYYVANRDKLYSQNRQWIKDNPEKDKGYHRTYRQNHREEKRIADALYRLNHRAERNLYNNDYMKQHPDRARAKTAKRRARKLAAGGTFTVRDIQRQYKIQNGLCWWCLEPVGNDYHVDHLIPLAKGGHNGPSNIVIACPGCNLNKRDKLPDEFCGRLF